MSRTDTHFDGMLRHLGAAYYDSLHGRATQADVTRAVDTVAEHLNEHAGPPRPDGRMPASGWLMRAHRPGCGRPRMVPQGQRRDGHLRGHR